MEANETKWTVAQDPDGLSYCTRTEGVGDGAKSSRTDSFHPDLDGEDVLLISDFCSRFRWSVRSLVDECRRSESKRLASAECERLNSRKDDNGDN